MGSLSQNSFLHSTAMRWQNIDDAKREIIDAVGDLSGVEIFGSQILVACYACPPKTVNGIIMGAKTTAEYLWQGKVGLILKLGPTALSKLKEENYNGRMLAVGDWVYFRIEETFQLSVCGAGAKPLMLPKKDGGQDHAREWQDGWMCRLIYASDIYGRVTEPASIV